MYGYGYLCTMTRNCIEVTANLKNTDCSLYNFGSILIRHQWHMCPSLAPFSLQHFFFFFFCDLSTKFLVCDHRAMVWSVTIPLMIKKFKITLRHFGLLFGTKCLLIHSNSVRCSCCPYILLQQKRSPDNEGLLILCHNCVALLHCILLHRNCDVTALWCCMKVKFFLT